MPKRLGIAVLLLELTLALTLADARVLRVEISSRSDVSNGKPFGNAGAYERIEGRVYLAVSVANPHNQRIVDLDKAVNLKNGQVEFSADFVALRPKDSKKSNGSMLLEIPNRGHSRIVALLDGGDWNAATDAGDAWLLRSGYTFVALGWQWDAVGDDALKLYAPIAKENGKTITGLLRGDLMPSKVMEDIPPGHLIIGNLGGTEYPVTALQDPRNSLTVRDSREAPRLAMLVASGSESCRARQTLPEMCCGFRAATRSARSGDDRCLRPPEGWRSARCCFL